MKKIVSNTLVVSTQLIIGGLFLFMLFSDNNEDNKVVVARNDNLNKMADSVSELFVVEKEIEKSTVADTQEVDLVSDEELKQKEEEERLAQEQKAQEEALIKQKEEEEKARKEKEAEQAAVSSSNNQSVEALQSYAYNLVINSYGWSEADFNALVSLWNMESKWNPNCYNSSSGAYGIPQALPGSKMASEGSDYNTNGETQIRWGLKYIQSRYGSPSAAWEHFCNVNWY